MPSSQHILVFGFFLAAVSAVPIFAQTPQMNGAKEDLKPTLADPCAVVSVERAAGSAKVWSANGEMYLVNEKDKKGTYQIYVGTKSSDTPVCISSTKNSGGPLPDRDKMQAHWHPSGKWIVLAGEKSNHIGRLLPSGMRQGLVECGIWMDMYATSPDGSRWRKLGSMDGFTGVAFTPDGTKAVWAECIGPVGKSTPFGQWQLKIADFVVKDETPHLEHTTNIPLPGKWFEPGNFSPNGHDLLITADVGLTDARGQDQFILDINTGKLTNLTNSPHVWDEHGLFSRDGKKIVFMSSYPYRDVPNSWKILGLKTEFMMMDSDGTNLCQLTHFQVPGHPESTPGGSTAAVAWFNADGTALTALQLLSGKRFPNYDVWEIRFCGPCGNNR